MADAKLGAVPCELRLQASRQLRLDKVARQTLPFLKG